MKIPNFLPLVPHDSVLVVAPRYPPDHSSSGSFSFRCLDVTRWRFSPLLAYGGGAGAERPSRIRRVVPYSFSTCFSVSAVEPSRAPYTP